MGSMSRTFHKKIELSVIFLLLEGVSGMSAAISPGRVMLLFQEFQSHIPDATRTSACSRLIFFSENDIQLCFLLTESVLPYRVQLVRYELCTGECMVSGILWSVKAWLSQGKQKFSHSSFRKVKGKRQVYAPASLYVRDSLCRSLA